MIQAIRFGVGHLELGQRTHCCGVAESRGFVGKRSVWQMVSGLAIWGHFLPEKGETWRVLLTYLVLLSLRSILILLSPASSSQDRRLPDRCSTTLSRLPRLFQGQDTASSFAHGASSTMRKMSLIYSMTCVSPLLL